MWRGLWDLWQTKAPVGKGTPLKILGFILLKLISKRNQESNVQTASLPQWTHRGWDPPTQLGSAAALASANASAMRAMSPTSLISQKPTVMNFEWLHRFFKEMTSIAWLQTYLYTVFYSESMFGRVSSNIWSLHTFAILWGPLPKHASNVPKLLPSFGSLGHIVLWQEWFQRAHYTQHWSTTRTDHTLNMPTPVANVWAPCHSDEPGPLAAMHWRLTQKPLRFGPVSDT